MAADVFYFVHKVPMPDEAMEHQRLLLPAAQFYVPIEREFVPLSIQPRTRLMINQCLITFDALHPPDTSFFPIEHRPSYTSDVAFLHCDWALGGSLLNMNNTSICHMLTRHDATSTKSGASAYAHPTAVFANPGTYRGIEFSVRDQHGRTLAWDPESEIYIEMIILYPSVSMSAAANPLFGGNSGVTSSAAPVVFGSKHLRTSGISNYYR